MAIADTDYDFAEYPVVMLEFSSVDVRQGENLKQYIVNITNQHASRYGVTLEIDTYEQRFAELVSKLHLKSGKKIVLLVDEYDKPILDNLFNDQLSAIRSVMNRFYAGVKSLDRHLKFVFITGVSKFAKVSVFSGMNHLSDISMDWDYATLCGITQQELENQFAQPITTLANKEQLDKAQMLAKVKHWYNGYYFEENAPGVYNPFSLLSLFKTQKFKNYWFTTATPTFLLDLLQKKRYDLKNLTEVKVGSAAFEASDPQEMDIQSLFVQTGYLTIKSYNDPRYQLDFPNYEVKKSFYDSVAARYAQLERGAGQSYTFDLIDALQAGNLDTFFKTLKIFFANIPYNITLKHEKYYQSLFYALFKLIGLSIEAEVHTNEGRIGTQMRARNLCSDEVSPGMGEGSTTRMFNNITSSINCVVQTDDTVYIIEFKLNGTKEEALQQIHDNHYSLKYRGGGKPIILLGVEFDQTSRNLGDFIQATG